MGAPPAATMRSSMAISASRPGGAGLLLTNRVTSPHVPKPGVEYFSTLRPRLFLNAGVPLIFCAAKAVATASEISRNGATAARYIGLRYVSRDFRALLIAASRFIAAPSSLGDNDVNISCRALPPSVLVLSFRYTFCPSRLAMMYWPGCLLTSAFMFRGTISPIRRSTSGRISVYTPLTNCDMLFGEASTIRSTVEAASVSGIRRANASASAIKLIRGWKGKDSRPPACMNSFVRALPRAFWNACIWVSRSSVASAVRSPSAEKPLKGV